MIIHEPKLRTGNLEGFRPRQSLDRRTICVQRDELEVFVWLARAAHVAACGPPVSTTRLHADMRNAVRTVVERKELSACLVCCGKEQVCLREIGRHQRGGLRVVLCSMASGRCVHGRAFDGVVSPFVTRRKCCGTIENLLNCTGEL